MLRLFLFFIQLIVICSCKGPKAFFTIEKSSFESPARVSFINKSINSTDFTWYFGDGSPKSHLANPTHSFYHSGRYEVTLEAKKNNRLSKTKAIINIFPPKSCLAEIQTTAGKMLIKLNDATHDHRDNFIHLSETGYYEGMLFHRVIKGFMIQTGDPDSKLAKQDQKLGSGGPHYTIKSEISDTLFHIKGAVAAARLSDEANPQKSSSGSQFYIVQGRPVPEHVIESYELQKGIKYTTTAKDILKNHGGTPQLDKEYTIFGYVIEGLEIIDEIANAKTDQNDRPITDIKILKISIIK